MSHGNKYVINQMKMVGGYYCKAEIWQVKVSFKSFHQSPSGLVLLELYIFIFILPSLELFLVKQGRYYVLTTPYFVDALYNDNPFSCLAHWGQYTQRAEIVVGIYIFHGD